MDIKTYILGLLLSIPGLVIALSLHEFAHGYAAYLMGDNTAKYSGRLSLNPLSHLDPVGTLCLFLFRFGWAKPVPINPYNFNKRRSGIITVSIAGPFMNFIVALISAFLLEIIIRYMPLGSLKDFLYYIVYYTIVLNVGLMCFNLIPIPPLDGSKVLAEILPYRYRNAFYEIERYSSFILMALLFTNALSPVLSTMRSFVFNIINMIVGLVF